MSHETHSIPQVKLPKYNKPVRTFDGKKVQYYAGDHVGNHLFFVKRDNQYVGARTMEIGNYEKPEPISEAHARRVKARYVKDFQASQVGGTVASENVQTGGSSNTGEGQEESGSSTDDEEDQKENRQGVQTIVAIPRNFRLLNQPEVRELFTAACKSLTVINDYAVSVVELGTAIPEYANLLNSLLPMFERTAAKDFDHRLTFILDNEGEILVSRVDDGDLLIKGNVRYLVPIFKSDENIIKNGLMFEETSIPLEGCLKIANKFKLGMLFDSKIYIPARDHAADVPGMMYIELMPNFFMPISCEKYKEETGIDPYEKQIDCYIGPALVAETLEEAINLFLSHIDEDEDRRDYLFGTNGKKAITQLIYDVHEKRRVTSDEVMEANPAAFI